MPTILPLDTRVSGHRPLAGLVADRIEQHARKHQPEVNAAEYTAGLMARLWLRDPNVLVLAAIDPESAEVVGHAVASLEQVGSERWVTIAQVRGESRMDAVKTVIAWAKVRETPKVLLHVHSSAASKDWAPLGFKLYRHMMRLPLNGNGHREAPTPANPEPVMEPEPA
jgi:hypothetical protein